MSVFDDLTLQERLLQTDSATQEKDLWPSQMQGIKASEEERIAGGLVLSYEKLEDEPPCTAPLVC